MVAQNPGLNKQPERACDLDLRQRESTSGAHFRSVTARKRHPVHSRTRFVDPSSNTSPSRNGLYSTASVGRSVPRTATAGEPVPSTAPAALIRSRHCAALVRLGDAPEVQGLAAHLPGLDRFPVTHVEVMRHDARAHLELLPQARSQAQVDLGQQVERDDSGRGDIALEEVTHAEGDELRHSGLLGIGTSLLDAHRGTPAVALHVQCLLALALVGVAALGGSGFTAMVEYTAPVFWLFFLLTGLAVFVLRRRIPHHPRPFRVPGYPFVPLVFCAACAYMLWSSVGYVASQELLRWNAGWISVAVLALGLVLLLWFRARSGGKTFPLERRASDGS